MAREGQGRQGECRKVGRRVGRAWAPLRIRQRGQSWCGRLAPKVARVRATTLGRHSWATRSLASHKRGVDDPLGRALVLNWIFRSCCIMGGGLVSLRVGLQHCRGFWLATSSRPAAVVFEVSVLSEVAAELRCFLKNSS